MSTVDSWRHGGVTYPLTASTDNSLLQDADPALYYAIDLFRTVLEKYVAPRLLAQAALEDLRFPTAVARTLHYDPTPYLLADEIDVFPLFCLYRVEENWDQHTVSFDKATSTWEWVYLLPPLTPRQIEQLQPILRTVGVVISTFAMQSFDPSFNAGATLRDVSGVQRMMAGPVKYGNFERVAEGQDKWWRAVTGRLMVSERSAIEPTAFEVFEGTNIIVDHKASDGTVVEECISIETHGSPVVTAIGPTSGPTTGNTAVAITGSGFRVGTTPKVLIGGAFASNVVVASATRIDALTPEHEAYPTFAADVVVIGADEQVSEPLEAAFTFISP